MIKPTTIKYPNSLGTVIEMTREEFIKRMVGKVKSLRDLAEIKGDEWFNQLLWETGDAAGQLFNKLNKEQNK